MIERRESDLRGFLDYYEQHSVIPVSQDHVPFDAFRRQRLHLYGTLGLPPIAFRNARVLEIGPGTGIVAEFIDSLDPQSLHLLDANPASIRSLESRINSGRLNGDRVSLTEADFHADHLDLGTFEIVLAEGCLPMQVDPLASLRSIKRFVSADCGVLVITCAEQVGTLPEICRRLLKPAFVARSNGDFDESIRLAERYFAADLRTLPAVTRTPLDWVVDQIFHPWPEGWALELDRAVDSLPEYNFLGSSPRFFVDWRWYKRFGDPTEGVREHLTAQWETATPTLLDSRLSPFEIRAFDTSYSREIRHLATKFDREVRVSWLQDSYSNESDIRSTISDLLSVLAREDVLVGAHRSLSEFARELPRLIDGDFTGEIPEFRSWWGRGQQYLSMTRGLPEFPNR